MDFLTLYLCSKCTCRKTSLRRMLLGAGSGAAGSLILLFLPESPALIILSGIMLSGIMVYITYGKMGTIPAFLRQCILVWGCGALSGGILSVLLSMGNPVYTKMPGKSSYPTAYLTAVVICILLARLFTYRKGASFAEITIRRGSRTAKTTALVDTGNLLKDPLSGSPVILVSAKSIEYLYPVLHSGNIGENTKLRLIPSGSVGGEKLLYGIIPDEVKVDGIVCRAVLVVEDIPENHYGGYGALCPGSLIQT